MTTCNARKDMDTPQLTAKAHMLIARLEGKLARQPLTEEDIELMRKYPRHTLEQARHIDSAHPSGMESQGTGEGFLKCQFDYEGPSCYR